MPASFAFELVMKKGPAADVAKTQLPSPTTGSRSKSAGEKVS